jgi:hypothetical protein
MLSPFLFSLYLPTEDNDAMRFPPERDQQKWNPVLRPIAL